MIYEHIVPANPEVLDPDKDEIIVRFFTIYDIKRATQILKPNGGYSMHEIFTFKIKFKQLKLIEERKIDYVLIAPE